MIRDDLQRLKNLVEGRTVFILGGGPSVTPDILKKLNDSGSLVFCLNSSVKFIKSPCGLLWCDDSWAANNIDAINSVQCPKFAVKANAQAYIRSNIKGFGSATVLHKESDFGISMDINCVCGNNSGANSINLLVNCGADIINLIGFDMKADGNVAHFHTDYTYAIRPSVYSDIFIPSINSLAEGIKDANVKTKIFNCNAHSNLKCFEFKDISNFIDME